MRHATPLLPTLALAVALAVAPPAQAEVALSLYGGVQGAWGGMVDLREPSRPGHSVGRSLDPDQEGRSLEAPFYYGRRATWWRTPLLGMGAEINHAKACASK